MKVRIGFESWRRGRIDGETFRVIYGGKMGRGGERETKYSAL